MAIEEFSRDGYGGVSMDHLAERVGVTKPLIYHYFGSKDGLYEACIRRVGERLHSEVSAVQSGPFGDRAAASIVAMIDALDAHRGDWTLLLYDRSVHAGLPVFTVVQQYRAALAAVGATAVAEFLAEVGNDDALDRELLTEMWLTTVSSVIGWWLRHDEVTAQDMAERVRRVTRAVTSMAG